MSQSPKPIRLAVVGYGFGRFHVQTLADMPGAEVIAVADRSNEDLEPAASQYGFKPYRDALAMLKQESLDALVIATPPKGRDALIAAGVKNNLAMFIEKPWASDRDHARTLARLCADAKQPVMVGFSFRYHPAIVKLRELIDAELGSPRMLCGQYVFQCPVPNESWLWDPGNGNGFINENSCHLFDAVCYLMGRPVRVFAEGGRFDDKPSEDAATITLRFESGAIAALTCGAIGSGPTSDYPRIELFAEHGQARLTGHHHIWRSLDWSMRGATATHQMVAPSEQLGATRYTHALDHFIQCVKEHAAPSATVDDAVWSVDIAMAVIESARTGSPVDL